MDKDGIHQIQQGGLETSQQLSSFSFLKTKLSHVSRMCFQFWRPCCRHNVTVLHHASWREEETSSSYLPRGPRQQRYEAKAETWSSGAARANIHPDRGSECQGCSPAVAINKPMQFYSSSAGFVVVLFKRLFLESTGRSPGQLSGCLLCEGLGQLVHIPQCWKTEHHIFPEEFSTTIARVPRTTENIYYSTLILKRLHEKRWTTLCAGLSSSLPVHYLYTAGG